MGTCNSSTDARNIVENFHLNKEENFINYLDKKYVYDAQSRKPNYEKLNTPINMYDDTILHYATFHGKVQICKYLINKNCDPSKKNRRKKSPLDIAMEKKNKELIQIFEKKQL